MFVGQSKWLVILCLIIAGEMIFSLPFHIARYFRPTYLEAFQLSNTALGDIFAVYGITAMLCYYPGGIIADRFSDRKLMTASLCLTALGGLYLAQIPGVTGLMFIFAYWGMTSILLFWAALIRATRDWGGHLQQGKAFGLLDGGRGLVAALAAIVAVTVFELLLPDDLSALDNGARQQALAVVIYLYSALTLLAAILVYIVIPESNSNEGAGRHSLNGIRHVFRQPIIWLQAIVVICAYCGYKGLDNYALYAKEVLAMNEVEAARLTSIAAFLRPVSAIAAGILVDRYCSSGLIKIAFAVLMISYAILSFSAPSSTLVTIIYLNLILTFIAVFAIRGVYFALLEETRVAKNITGTAVGLISVIGFTPDVFFAAVSGRLLDSAPGIQGHQLFFMLLTVISLIGMTTTVVLAKMNRTSK